MWHHHLQGVVNKITIDAPTGLYKLAKGIAGKHVLKRAQSAIAESPKDT